MLEDGKLAQIGPWKPIRSVCAAHSPQHEERPSRLTDGTPVHLLLRARGAQDPASAQFLLVGVLQGHTAAVQQLQVGGTFLFSASRDNTIKQWDLSTGQGVCSVATMHTEFMMGLRLYDQYLFSAGLDGKVVGECATNSAPTHSLFASLPFMLELIVRALSPPVSPSLSASTFPPDRPRVQCTTSPTTWRLSSATR